MAIVRCTWRLVFPTGSRSGTNTWHVRAGGPDPDGAEVRSAMEAVQAYYMIVKQNLWTVGYSAIWDGTATTVEAEPQALQTGEQLGVSGTGTDGSPAAGVGLVTTWRTALASRSGRGRTFHCPMRDDAFEPDGTINSVPLGNIRTAAETLVSASLADTGWALGVYSPTDGVLRDFTSSTVHDKVAYLSSRRGR